MGVARPRRIDRDWSCDHCGYNLRGLWSDRPCPGCGRRNYQVPEPDRSHAYAAWLDRGIADTEPATRFGAFLLAAVVGGPFAIAVAFVQNTQAVMAIGIMALVVVAPVIEEVLKVGILAMLIERRPYLFANALHIRMAAWTSAAIFASLENFYYLELAPGMQHYTVTDTLVQWRWIACFSMHVIATGIVAEGLVRIWERAITELRPPRLEKVLPWLIAAAVLHGAFNGVALLLEMHGFFH